MPRKDFTTIDTNTSFAVYVDADYRRRHGEPTFIAEYGAALSGRRGGG